MADDNRSPKRRVTKTVVSTLRNVKRGLGRSDDVQLDAIAPAPNDDSAPALSLSRFVRDGVTYRRVETGLKVESATASLSEVLIPSEVDGAPVTVIGKDAFRGRADLTTVTLPESIITVGAGAFAGCTGLTEIELPSGLEVLNAETFAGCAALRTVWLPAMLTRIARQAFADCVELERTPHYAINRGVSSGLAVDRNLIEDALPTELEYLGAEAFRGCASLRSVIVPFKLTEIPASAFEDCKSLEVVWLHSHLTAIGDRAFDGCLSLSRVRVPSSAVKFGDAAFCGVTRIVGDDGSAVVEYARANSLQCEVVGQPHQVITSAFGARGGASVEDLLDSADALSSFVQGHEVRPPALEIIRTDDSAEMQSVDRARFERDGDVYRPVGENNDGDVTISMVGDLMCSFYQQTSSLVDGRFSFEGALDDVESLLRSADLAIGNLEAMVAPSYEFMHASRYVEDRPYLNAPPAFLAAVRNAGFDVVMNAQNHMYDTGAKGVLETLAALNKAELIHGGMYAHQEETRHLLFDIRGMRIAVVAFLDPARQKMKQANFTAHGLEAFASPLTSERVSEGIAAARDAGAEFVLAYCHWGREYTDRVTKRQADFAQMVVDAGADYVFGSHSHCPQPYTILRSSDGRRVPVIYSGGNFLSDISRYKPYSEDTFVASLTLTRNAEGRVVVASDGYTPCRILTDRSFRGYSRVVPCSALRAGAYDYNPVDAEADIRRIETTMGLQYALLERTGEPAVSRSAGQVATESEDDESLIEAFSLREPAFAVQEPYRSQDNDHFVRDTGDGIWRRARDRARGEAVLMCSGSLMYDRTLERDAQAGDVYEFRTHFRYLRPVLDQADLAVGSLGTMVADEFPALSAMPAKYVEGHYSNARSEYVDAARYAGFDCLALANPFNLDGGVRGVISTERAVRERGVVPSGLGRAKTPIFDVNGIRIAVVSYTTNSYRVRDVITGEGASKLLNVLDESHIRRTIQEARAAGAQFVLSYLDCRSASAQLRRADRLAAAEVMAECGADYVVCTLPNVVSSYISYESSDGRAVPIATGIGTVMAGTGLGEETASALLRIVVRLNDDGSVVVDDSYIPMQRFLSYRGSRGPVVPAHEYYNDEFHDTDFGNGPERVRARIGDAISLDRSRRVDIHSHFRPQMTPAQIAETLETEFTEDALRVLGGAVDDPVHSIVVRSEDLFPGCVAVLARRTSEDRNFDEITVEAAVEAGAVMAVSLEPHSELPTLVVDEPWDALTQLMSAIREQYAPIVVAVTGTAGKTTTQEMLGEVFSRHFCTLRVEGNYNTKRTAGLVMQKLSHDDEAYIQEVHGGSPGSAHMLSCMIRPDIALITSIGEAHLEQMGSLEAIIEGKMQIVDGLRSGGTLILNDDSPHLRAQAPDVRTVRYSLEDRDVDYRARNIKRTGDALEFEIVAPDGVHSAVIRSQGMHNVSNALGVFVAGREAGIPAQTIIGGISRHRPSSTRQNLVEAGGYSLLVDAYNSNPVSLESGVETLCEIPLSPGGRRVAVLGDMGEQGDRFEENHRAVGDMIAEFPVDLVICSGPGMKLAAQRLYDRGVEVHHFETYEQIAASLHTFISTADAVLFKASGAVDLEKKVVFPVFGRII